MNEQFGWEFIAMKLHPDGTSGECKKVCRSCGAETEGWNFYRSWQGQIRISKTLEREAVLDSHMTGCRMIEMWPEEKPAT